MYILWFNVICSPEWINFFHRMLGVGKPTAAQSIHTLCPKTTDVFFGSTVHCGGTMDKEHEKKVIKKTPNIFETNYYYFIKYWKSVNVNKKCIKIFGTILLVLLCFNLYFKYMKMFIINKKNIYFL